MWVVSGSFWLFLLSRIVGGAFGGNLSVATAAVADVTTRKERSRAMGIVGAAFGLGLVTGPVLGAVCAQVNLLAAHPSLERFGINPYSVPALVSLGFCLANLAWVHRSFRETLPESARSGALETRLRNPIRAILNLDNADVRRANVVAFVYAVAFVAMEATLTYLAADRFGYTVGQNGIMLGFLGVCSIVTQGFIVRILLKKADEIPVLAGGLVSTCVGLLVVGLSAAAVDDVRRDRLPGDRLRARQPLDHGPHLALLVPGRAGPRPRHLPLARVARPRVHAHAGGRRLLHVRLEVRVRRGRRPRGGRARAEREARQARPVMKRLLVALAACRRPPRRRLLQRPAHGPEAGRDDRGPEARHPSRATWSATCSWSRTSGTSSARITS